MKPIGLIYADENYNSADIRNIIVICVLFFVTLIYSYNVYYDTKGGSNLMMVLNRHIH